MICAYCQERRAVNADHVVPKSLRRKYKQHRKREARPRIPHELLGTEPACFSCNIRKGARRLVPPSWAEKVPLLNAFFGGTPFRVWDGSLKALREVVR